MKKWFFLFFLSIISLQAEKFVDPITGLSLEIPAGYVFDEEGSLRAPDKEKWSYEYVDENLNALSIEVEAYDQMRTLPEHLHHTITEDECRDKVIYEGLEFRSFKVNGREFTKSKLRILAVSDHVIEPICMCDFLFVEGQYGFTISFMIRAEFEIEPMMESLLQTISFE